MELHSKREYITTIHDLELEGYGCSESDCEPCDLGLSILEALCVQACLNGDGEGVITGTQINEALREDYNEEPHFSYATQFKYTTYESDGGYDVY